MSPRPSARCSAASASTASPARPRSWSSPTREQDPRHVAIDLLAQAEHDESAQSILITDDAGFADAVAAAVEAELADLAARRHRRRELARPWRIILVRDWDEAAALVNRLAPEHLQIMVAEPRAPVRAHPPRRRRLPRPRPVPEAVGDYVAGPNHVLPTGRTARFASGLSVFDFLKRTTWVEADARGPAAGSARPRWRWPRRRG